MKDTISDTGDSLKKTSRPAFKDMIVSIARHKTCIEDTALTYQFPLSILENWTMDGGSPREPTPSAFPQFNSIIENSLRVARVNMSVVWCLSESGQLAIINDINSLRAAIMDHQNAGKSTIQLYVVKNSDLMNLPKHIPK
ncbi:hypothetical protein KCU77_g5023, partial [Aureobasidium melanogenum]